MIFPILGPQGGNSYAIQKECASLPLPVNLSHVNLQHLELLLSNCNSFTKPHKKAFVAVQYGSLLCFCCVFGFCLKIADHSL